MGALKYVVIGVVVVVVLATALVLLPTLHRVPVQYVGSPGYEAFVPDGQTINYNGHTDPEGELILNNGNTIHNVILDGQYANTIIQDHNQIDQLNNQFVGQTDPVNDQPYVPLQDLYVIKGQVPVENVTINGQTYTVIEANKYKSSRHCWILYISRMGIQLCRGNEYSRNICSRITRKLVIIPTAKHNRNGSRANNAI